LKHEASLNEDSAKIKQTYLIETQEVIKLKMSSQWIKQIEFLNSSCFFLTVQEC
jgi:hypothetical protein